ncbi:MAG: hypothetical protein ACLQBA_06030 [Candidatus Binataceae bacterium]
MAESSLSVRFFLAGAVVVLAVLTVRQRAHDPTDGPGAQADGYGMLLGRGIASNDAN